MRPVDGLCVRRRLALLLTSNIGPARTYMKRWLAPAARGTLSGHERSVSPLAGSCPSGTPF